MPSLQHELRSRGLRLTPQRQLVLEAVTRLGHATPDEVLTEVQRSAGSVNGSTIYRTLELLEDLGLVTHTHLGHGPPTYHPATHDEHLHLVCRSCGTVTEVDVEVARGLAARLDEEHGFAADIQHVSVFGTCAQCRASGVAPGS